MEADALKQIRERFAQVHPVCICAAVGDPTKAPPKLPPTKIVNGAALSLTVCTRCGGTRRPQSV